VTLFSAINNAALIFTYLGEIDKARRICVAELAWIAELLSKLSPAKAAHLLRLSIDPWVNYGHLLGSKGAAEDARAHFAVDYSLNSGAGAALGPCHIPPQIWAKIKVIDPGIEAVTQAVYVIDSLKSYFLSGDFRGALQFIQDLHWAGCAGLQCMLDEGRLIVAARLGLHNRVLAATDKPPLDADLYYEAILILYNKACLISSRWRQCSGLLKSAETYLSDSVSKGSRSAYMSRVSNWLGV
jgi:hypothetical protein